MKAFNMICLFDALEDASENIERTIVKQTHRRHFTAFLTYLSPIGLCFFQSRKSFGKELGSGGYRCHGSKIFQIKHSKIVPLPVQVCHLKSFFLITLCWIHSLSVEYTFSGSLACYVAHRGFGGLWSCFGFRLRFLVFGWLIQLKNCFDRCAKLDRLSGWIVLVIAACQLIYSQRRWIRFLRSATLSTIPPLLSSPPPHGHKPFRSVFPHSNANPYAVRNLFQDFNRVVYTLGFQILLWHRVQCISYILTQMQLLTILAFKSASILLSGQFPSNAESY